MSNINVNNITPLAGITGTVSVSGSLLVSGSITANGNIILGDGTSDSVSFGAEVSSSIVPDADNKYNLGSSTKEWKDLYIDGTGNIDTLIATNITSSGDVLFGEKLNISGDLDVDGIANLDAVDIDGAVDIASTLTVASHVTASGNLKVAGTIVSTGNINSAALITAEHLTSTDDATIQDTLTVGTIVNVNTTHVTASGNISASGTGSFGRLEGMSGGVLNIATGIFGTATTTINDNVLTTGWIKTDTNVTASGNISASGNIYAEDFYIGNEQFTDNTAHLNIFQIGNAGNGSLSLTNITASGNISASGTIFANNFQSAGGDVGGISFTDELNLTGNLTASGNISSSGTITANEANILGHITASGTVKAEHLYSTDDAVIDDDLSVGGNITATNVTASGTVTATGNISSSATISAEHLYSSDDAVITDTLTVATMHTLSSSILGQHIRDTHTFTGHITASGNISASYTSTGSFGRLLSHTIGGLSPISLTDNTSITGSLIVSQHVTASGNISASGYISSSHIVGLSGSFQNIVVTGSGLGMGSGSFGYVYAHTVEIHNHEIVGGQGLSVIGVSTTLGTSGQNDQPVIVYGNITGSNLWLSGSGAAANGGGHISASNMTLSENLTILGDISGSYISASKGFWTAGEYSGSSLHVENGISGSYISASRGIYTAGHISVIGTGSFGSHITSSGNISASGYVTAMHITASGNISSSGNLSVTGHMTASGNISSSGYVIAMHMTASGNISSSGYVIAQHVTASGNISSSGYVTAQHVTASGNISASGYIVAQHITASGNISGSATSTLTIGGLATFGTSTVIIDGSAGHITASGNINAGGNISASGYLSTETHITASGNISSSGYIAAMHITASGNISASGTGSFDYLHVGNISSSGYYIGTNYRSFYIAAAGMTPSITNGAAAATVEKPGVAGTGNTFHTIDYLSFDHLVNEYANFQVAMPDEWDQGSIKAKFYWQAADTLGTVGHDDVNWGVNATSLQNQDLMSGAASTFVTVADKTIANPEKLHITAPTSEITVAGTHKSSSLVFFRVQRDAATPLAATTHYLNKAYLLGVGIQYRERAHAEIPW